MRHYQIFPFSPEGRLLEAVSLDFDADAAAIRRCIQGEFANGCELWEGFRFVGRFHGAAPQERPAAATPSPRVMVH